MVLPLYDDQDVNTCLRYLEFKLENPTSTGEEVAAHLGYSRNWVYQLLKKWRTDGTLDHSRELIMASRNQNIQSALDNVIDKWPLIINGLVEDAIHDTNATVRRRAAEFLRDSVVSGYLASLPRGQSEEQDYLNSTTEDSFNPTEIPLILQPDEPGLEPEPVEELPEDEDEDEDLIDEFDL